MGLGIFAERWMDQPFLLSAGWIYLFSLAGLIYNFGKARMGQTLSRKVRTDLEKFGLILNKSVRSWTAVQKTLRSKSAAL